MLIKRVDGTKFRLYHEYEGKEGMENITRLPGIVFGSSTRKRKVGCFERGETSGTTIAHLSKQLDEQGKYLDDLQDLIQMGNELNHARFLAILLRNPPDHNYREHLPKMKRWVERMGYAPNNDEEEKRKEKKTEEEEPREEEPEEDPKEDSEPEEDPKEDSSDGEFIEEEDDDEDSSDAKSPRGR